MTLHVTLQSLFASTFDKTSYKHPTNDIGRKFANPCGFSTSGIKTIKVEFEMV